VSGQRRHIKAVEAAVALTKRGVRMLISKRAVEATVERGVGVVDVPTVDSLAELGRELAAAGLAIRAVGDAPVDVKALRLKLGMTQDQFALRYGLDPAAIATPWGSGWPGR
jgi:hypothetical protein